MHCRKVLNNLLLLVIFIDAMMKDGLRKVIARRKCHGEQFINA
jgi:hypothetical protein